MAYLDLDFNESERREIASAWVDGVLDWASPNLQAIRSKIRRFHRALRGDRCCYCQKSFADDHPLAVDIEHVLPKSKFHMLAITAVNLTVACKRCNMTIKKSRIDFLHGRTIAEVSGIYDQSETYEFVHPNLDEYDQHLQLLTTSIGKHMLWRYMVKANSIKGIRTVDYFDLRSLEVDDLDRIQGIEGMSGSERALQIRRLLEVD